MSGAALVGRILAEVASGGRGNASELAARLGAARTTTFQAIARLEAAGFVERDARGILSPGPLASTLGYAAFGLAPIAGAVEALLPALRDNTEALVEVVVEEEAGPLVLAQRGPASARPDGLVGEAVEARIASPVPAFVRLWQRAGAAEPEKAAARRSVEAVAEALSRALDAPKSRSRRQGDAP